jgi:hypothetical protein
MAGIGGRCVLCAVGIPGGTYLAADRHEIVGKGRLPGKDNWEQLFALENIAPACRPHHMELQHLRLLWLKSMVLTGLARVEQYSVAPFDVYWQATPYPPCGECVGHFGYGTEVFRSVARLSDSLAQLYRIANSEFDEFRFCETCPQVVRCRRLTPKDTCEHIGGSPKWKSKSVTL